VTDWYADTVAAAQGATQSRNAETYKKTQDELTAAGAGLDEKMGDYDSVAMSDDNVPMDGNASMDYARPLTQQLGSRDARTGERLTSPALENPDLWQTEEWKPGDPLYIRIRRGRDDPEIVDEPSNKKWEPTTLRKYTPRSEEDIVMGGVAAAAEAGVTTLARGVYKFGQNVWEFGADVSDWLDGMAHAVTGVDMGNQPYRPPTAEQVGIPAPANVAEAVSTDVIRYGLGLTAATKALEGLALGTKATTFAGTTAKAAATGAATDVVVTDPKVDASLYDVAKNFFAAESALATGFTVKEMVDKGGPQGVMMGRMAAGVEGALLGELIGGTLSLTGKGFRGAKNSVVGQDALKAGRALWLKGEHLEEIAHNAMRPMMRSTVSSGMSPEMGVWLGVWLMAKIMKGVRQLTPELIQEVKPLGATDAELTEAWNKAAKLSQRAKAEAMADWAQNAPRTLQRLMDAQMQAEARALLDAGEYHVTQYLQNARALGISDEAAMANWDAAAKARNDEQVASLLKDPQRLPAPNLAGLEALEVLKDPQVPTRAPKDYAGPQAKKNDIAREFQQRALDGVGGVPRNLDDSPENIERVARFFANEVELAARQPGSAADWYRHSIEDYHKIAAAIWPEIATDRNARLALDFATAITSNNEAVKNNMRAARKVYQYLRTEGKGDYFPENLAAIDANLKNFEAMESAFKVWNKGVRMLGRENFQKFLNTEWTKPELAAMGFPGAEIEAGMRAPGSIIFGPKVGGAFFQNLEGNLDRSTIDLWYRRTYGRATGAVMETNSALMNRAAQRMMDSANTPEVKKLLVQYTDRTEMPTDPEILEEVAADIFNGWARDKAKLGKTYKLGVSDEVDNFHKAAREYNNFKNDAINAPAPKERVIMERAALRTVAILEQKGYNTSPADVQALLWYWEQRLWKHKGLDIDSSTDYPTELAELAVKEGDLTNEQVQSILSRGQDPGRGDVTGGLGRRHGEDKRRFTKESERRKFYKDWDGDEFRARVAAGTNPEGVGQIYRRGNRGNVANLVGPDGKKLKFKGTVWSPADRPYVNRWKNFGVAVPKFVEADLAQSPKAYEGFASTLDSTRSRLDELIEAAPDKARKAAFKKAKLSLGNYSAEEYAESGARVFMSPDGDMGFALMGDDIVSVFKHPDSTSKEAAMHMLAAAIQAGGRKLDNFDGPLSELYAHVGMVPIARTPFDLKFKPPGWDARSMGKPDIVFMAYNPQSKGQKVLPADVPEFASYDEAAAARDHWLKTQGAQ
jgi:hypothetical protein